jgi:hypothetical protein
MQPDAAGAALTWAQVCDVNVAYLLPTYVLFAIWVGCGCGELLAAIGRRRPRLAPIAALVCAVFFVAPAPATAARVDARHDDRAMAFAQTVLAAAPPGAIIVTSEDRDSFALWYAHYALGERPDIAVAVGPLLDFPWYRASIRATYQWLRIPDALPEDWAIALATANDDPVCIIDPTEPPTIECAPHTP